MTPPVHLVVPGPISQVSGGTIYDRRMVKELRARGREVVVHELEGRFPLVDGPAVAAAAAMLGATEVGGRDMVVIDGLALPAFAPVIDDLGDRWAALVHHPLALESGLDPGTAAGLRASESRMLRRAGRVIVTSPRTRADVVGLGVEEARIGVVEPGTDPRPLAPAAGDPPHLLAVGALIARKGHDVLLAALARLRHLDWRLTMAGSTWRDHGAARVLRRMAEDSGLADRVWFAGELDDDALARTWLDADLFVLPSRHEGYGMALAEAVAHGLPVVSTTAGAIPDTVPEGARLLVPPDDPGALEAALSRVLTQPGLRERLVAGARRARTGLRTWREAGRRFVAELDEVGG